MTAEGNVTDNFGVFAARGKRLPAAGVRQLQRPLACVLLSFCFPLRLSKNTPQSNRRKQRATIKRNPFEELGAKDRLTGMKLRVFVLGFVDPFTGVNT